MGSWIRARAMMLSNFWEEMSVFDFWCGVRLCRTCFLCQSSWRELLREKVVFIELMWILKCVFRM